MVLVLTTRGLATLVLVTLVLVAEEERTACADGLVVLTALVVVRFATARLVAGLAAGFLVVFLVV